VGRPQMRTHHHRFARVAVALACSAALLAAAACSAAGGSPQPTEGPRPTTSAPTTQPSTSPPLTPEEVASAAALAAYEGYWDVGQRLLQAPGSRNWEPAIRRYADDTATAGGLSNAQTLLEYGTKQAGESTVDPEVTAVDLAAEPGPMVTITACFDPGTAESVKIATGEPAGTYYPPRFPRWDLLVTVIQYKEQPGSPWLVHSSEPRVDTPC